MGDFSNIIRNVLNEARVLSYDPCIIGSLCDFLNNYASAVLTEARNSASDPNSLTPGDVRFAIESIRSSAPLITFKEILECRRNINRQPLPGPPVRYGLKLPADRYCLSKTNYSLRKRDK